MKKDLFKLLGLSRVSFEAGMYQLGAAPSPCPARRAGQAGASR